MDAAKKRKAAAGAVLRKKPRRDKSEFVSVEVGMREFKKRLAATDAGAAAAGPAQVEDITQDVKRTRPRATTRARAAADAATADAAVATKKKAPARASAAKKTTPVKKTAPATAKRATAATKKVVAAAAEKKKKTPVKKATPAVNRTTRVAASKLTLAEVKLQLELEQKERVESRIQSLHRDAKPTAAALAAAAAAPVTVVATAAPAVTSPVSESTVDTAIGAPTTVATATAPALAMAASVGLEQSRVEPSVVAPSPTQPATANAILATQAHTPSALSITQTPVRAAPAPVTTDPTPSPEQNEFIIDDMEEDFMFAMALEEVERKLVPPQKPPLSETVAAATDQNTVASASVQPPPVACTLTETPVVSPILAKPPPTTVEPQTHTLPTQVPIATQTQQPTPTVEVTKPAAPVVEVASEVLEEMERLRRENELLRRSNELLQAAVTSPTQKETAAVKQPDGLHEHGTSSQGETDLHVVASSRATAVEDPVARYLDLARCDSDQDVKQTLSTLEASQPRERSKTEHSTASISAHPEQLSEVNASADNCEEIKPHENGQKSDDVKEFLEKLLPTERSPELPTADSSYQQASTTPQSIQSTQNRYPTSQPVVAEPERDYARETTPLKRGRVHAKDNTAEHVAAAPPGSDVGDVSDVYMSEVDEEGSEIDEEEDDETVTEEVVPASRTSTIDSGNYKEYKVHDEDDLEAVEDKSCDVVLDNTVLLSMTESNFAARPSTPIAAKTNDSSVSVDLGDTSKPATPANSEILERTTAPSNSEDDEEEEDDEVMVVNRVKRREVIALSSSGSESESESESEEEEASDLDEAPSGNVLEAALKAAGGDSRRKNQNKSSSTTGSSVKNDKASGSLHNPSEAETSMSSPPLPAKTMSKKRMNPSLSSAAKKAPSVKSSLLWPSLDDFYDFLLDMTPRNVRLPEQERVHLQQYARGKLPAQHSSIEDYCNVQLEAIMEELVASVSNTTDRRGGGGSGPTRQLSLSSVSPCGVQGPSTSSLGLSFGAIFSESGFSGSTSNSSDYILTFDASALGRKSSSDFLSGDLVLVRSPRWKNYEMCVFGVVLCDSVVAVGGKGSAGGKGGNGGSGDSYQICVLIRARKRDCEDAVENFSVLTELCLSNQRAPNWRWSLQQVHNTTTSAREFQAIKAISFLPNDLKQVLLRGQLVPSNKTEQVPKKPAPSSSLLSPRLLKYLQRHYNESQMQAIFGCLGEDSRVIIQGPPGTGKTKTILGLLSALLDGAGICTLQRAKGTARIRVGASLQSARTSAVSKTVAETSIRILVCAPSNAAVDELVVRVLSEGLYNGERGESYRPRIVRVGRPESSQELSSLAAAREASESKKNRKKMRKYAREVEEVLLESLVTKHRSTFPTVKQARQAIIKNAQIVFCTLSGAGSVAMCEFAQDFDALIIDEAAQAVEASTLIPFKFRPHRVVLVGDHRQLPATVISKKLVSMGYDRSLQQRLVENKSPVLLLTQQYRMHPEIAEFPSTYFYGGRLVQDGNMSNWTAQDYHRDRAFQPLLFLDVQGTQSQVSGSTSLRNMSEVETVVQLIRRLLKKFPHIEWKKRIGVIAPYKQQIYEVRGAIGKLESEFDRHLGIEVNTVDGFQGREKEIIIYSCVRTSHGGRRKKKRRSHGNEEEDVLDAFWADERRMNVAITRAKSSLWIVGNSNLLEQSRAWRTLIQHTKDHSRYIGDSAASLFAPSSSTRKTSKAPSK